MTVTFRFCQGPSKVPPLLLPFENCFLSIEGIGLMRPAIFFINGRSPQSGNLLPTQEQKRLVLLFSSFTSTHSSGGREDERENFIFSSSGRITLSCTAAQNNLSGSKLKPHCLFSWIPDIEQVRGEMAHSSCHGLKSVEQ